MTFVVGVLGPEPSAAIGAISGQLVAPPLGSTTGFQYHHDANKGVLYVGFHWKVQARDEAALKAALLLFLSCHVVVWVLPPGATPDASTLGTLRLLQQSKQLLAPSLAQLLAPSFGGKQEVGSCPPWSQPALLLLVCQAGSALSGLWTAKQQHEAQERLDTMLRTLFKRCRVVLAADHPAALCTLRPQGTAWLLGTLGTTPMAAMGRAFAALREGSEPGARAALDDSGGGTFVGQGAQQPGRAAVASLAGSEGAAGEAASDAALLVQLRLALQEHATHLAKQAAGAATAGAGLAGWRKAVAALAAALGCANEAGLGAVDGQAGTGGQVKTQQDEEGSDELQLGQGQFAESKSEMRARARDAHAAAAAPEGAAAAAAWIAGCTGLARQVSAAKCQRAVAAAKEAYLRAVPKIYPAAVHAAALQGALRVYASLARGPASLESERQLREECETLWRHGRQQCQAQSLWGHACLLAPHDTQEVPHSSRISYLLATCNGCQQVVVEDPFLPDASDQEGLPFVVPAQPGPHNHGSLGAAGGSQPGALQQQQQQQGQQQQQHQGQQHKQQQRQQQQGGKGSSGPAGGGSSLLEMVPLVVSGGGGRDGLGPASAAVVSVGPGSINLPRAPLAAATRPVATGVAHANAQEREGAIQPVEQQQQQQQQQQREARIDSGCHLEMYVLASGKPAQAAQLQQPGLLPGASSLHRFLLQVSDPDNEPTEEFPALGAAAPSRAKESAVPKVLNWPGGAAVAPSAGSDAAVPHSAAPSVPLGAGVSTLMPATAAAGVRKGGRKGPAAGKAGAGPPALLVGVEFESLGGQRALVTPAQLASCTASSLDLVLFPSSSSSSSTGSVEPGSSETTHSSSRGDAGAHSHPATDALADAAAEAIGAAAAAASAAGRRAAAGAAPSPAYGGAAAELMLTSALPIYLYASGEQLGSISSTGRPKGVAGKGKPLPQSTDTEGFTPQPGSTASSTSGSSSSSAGWWQLRRIFCATPPGKVLFEACPVVQLDLPGGLPAERNLVPSAIATAAAGGQLHQQQQQALEQGRQGHHGLTSAAVQGGPGGGKGGKREPAGRQQQSYVYRLKRPVQLPPDSLCCIALPWIYTLPGQLPQPLPAPASHPNTGRAAPTPAVSTLAEGALTAGAETGGPGPEGGGWHVAAPPLPGAGPLRAVLLGGTLLRPVG